MRILVILGLIVGSLTCLTLAFNVPLQSDQALVDGDTVVLDETTTVSYNGVPVTENNVQEDEVQEDGDGKFKFGENECQTTRGLKGTCMTVKECYPVLLPVESNSSTPSSNPELAEILIGISGFCAGAFEARSQITPEVFNQVMRSEVLLCCPSERPSQGSSSSSSSSSGGLDNNNNKPSGESVESDSFKAKSCGQLKIDRVNLANETSGKILKGRKAGIGEFPWMVALMNQGKQFCGGSLINSKTVVTAAHCVQHMTAQDVKNLELRLGDHNLYQSGEVAHESRGALKVLFHKGFSMNHLRNDIALIHLNKAVEFKSNIQPVCLHTGTPGFEDGSSNADVTGWGALSEGGSQPSDLRTVRVRVLTKAECLKKYANSANKITDGMVCAGSDNGEDSCQGDSGGPLTLDSRNQAKLIGIVSWGVGCGRYPGVYTKVPNYLSWITTNQAK